MTSIRKLSFSVIFDCSGGRGSRGISRNEIPCLAMHDQYCSQLSLNVVVHSGIFGRPSFWSFAENHHFQWFLTVLAHKGHAGCHAIKFPALRCMISIVHNLILTFVLIQKFVRVLDYALHQEIIIFGDFWLFWQKRVPRDVTRWSSPPCDAWSVLFTT